MKLRFEEAFHVAQQALRDGGCTFVVTENEHGAVLTTPPTGFVVGGAGFVYQLNDTHAPRLAPTVDDVYWFTEHCRGNAFGIWLDEKTNIWHFDEVTIHSKRSDACYLARERRQEAIYDLERSETIYVREAA